MNKQQARELKAKIQRIDTLIERFEEDTKLLHDSSVDVKNSTGVSDRQEELQNEIEQAASDILLLLDLSGQVETAGGEPIDLPNVGRTPVSGGSLPEPSNGRPEGRGPPPWANGGGNSGNNGNGNSGNNGN